MSQLEKIRLWIGLPARSHKSLQQYIFIKAVSHDHKYTESPDIIKSYRQESFLSAG